MIRLKHAARSLLRWVKGMDTLDYSLMVAFVAVALSTLTGGGPSRSGNVRSQDFPHWEVRDDGVRFA